ncbi:MAG: NUDIX domain-containing protein [Rhodobacteraceae bacterium]|nr:NUDIX domain-containing protein [Paracoccaceae bacterium]
MLKRVGEPPRADVRYRLRPGVYALLPLAGELLLTHQQEPDHDFQLPGGGIDPGEHPIAALHREVFEETGWRIGAPRRFGAFRRFTWMPEYDFWAEKICTVYIATPARPHGPPSEEGHTPLFLPPDDVIEVLANPGDRMMVRDWLTRR